VNVVPSEVEDPIWHEDRERLWKWREADELWLWMRRIGCGWVGKMSRWMSPSRLSRVGGVMRVDAGMMGW
jgi:NADH:ubiquinone oxidoreductase subunit B-like Fe-S oxidoreductase